MNEIDKLKIEVSLLNKKVEDLTLLVKQLSDTSYKTSRREIINREVQFMQKVYDKNGAIVTEINP
jgi:hypothetical protein